MFTGIVEELGTIETAEKVDTEWGPGLRLCIAAHTVLEGSDIGASIAVNGCCLTLVARVDDFWETDVSDETVDRTNIGMLIPGDRVNLERPTVSASPRSTPPTTRFVWP